MSAGTVEATTATGHVVGATYLSAYWRQAYRVESSEPHDDWRGETVTVQWQDGRETTHCTPVGTDRRLSARDLAILTGHPCMAPQATA